MSSPGQYQSAEDVGGSMNWGATINGSCEASLAYPHRSDSDLPELYDLQHHTMVVQPNNEGLELGHP